MRSIHLHLLLTITVLVIFYTIATAYQISIESSYDNLGATEEVLRRDKRQLENFDDEYPSASSQDAQEEPSFWDKVVKVALKLFSKFIEWLNS